MAVPKKKTSKSKRNMRRSHHSLDSVNVVEDSSTGILHRPHHIDSSGKYGGKKIVVVKSDAVSIED